ncbi:helix-turn-helix transcriptional regulator [Desulfonema magnum]|uniref:DNA-binding HTH domain-containing protein n=1 Tax=Desulfonema magnum TaxID=45655 RepID=A0A975BVU4_9BACT|nr:AraC family transcriptional regulator [Desulfonema magnum]QTA92573.1 DNA-binding HTH domain-containing protein [Desulfonema magnum]
MHSNLFIKNKSGEFEDWLTIPHVPKSETCWQVPEETGRGTLREIRFQSGIQLYIADYHTLETFVSKNEDHISAFGFRFCLSGRMRLRVGCFKDDLIIREGQSGFFYFSDTSGFHEEKSGFHNCRVLILIDPETFVSLMADEVHQLPVKFRISASEAYCDSFNSEDIVTPAMRMILEQIIHCPYSGTARRFFIEAKALELIACKLDQQKPVQCQPENIPALKTSDVNMVRYAGKLLSENLQEPPGIIELAKTLGISRTKLYYDFKRFYGTSPSEYLRTRRIEKARTLVEDGDMNLTEIAYFLGYSSSSHFGRAFRQYFGMAPSHYCHK